MRGAILPWRLHRVVQNPHGAPARAVAATVAKHAGVELACVACRYVTASVGASMPMHAKAAPCHAARRQALAMTPSQPLRSRCTRPLARRHAAALACSVRTARLRWLLVPETGGRGEAREGVHNHAGWRGAAHVHERLRVHLGGRVCGGRRGGALPLVDAGAAGRGAAGHRRWAAARAARSRRRRRAKAGVSPGRHCGWRPSQSVWHDRLRTGRLPRRRGGGPGPLLARAMLHRLQRDQQLRMSVGRPVTRSTSADCRVAPVPRTMQALRAQCCAQRVRFQESVKPASS